MIILALLGLLAASQAGLALATVGCEWVPEVPTCTSVSHMIDDSAADSLLADAGTCISNTAEGMQGCEEDLPQCQAVTVAGLSSFGICVPALAVIGAIDVAQAESLFQIEDCAGVSTPECDQVRENYYGLLGCPECIEEANNAAAIETFCVQAASEAECAEVSGLLSATAPAAGYEASDDVYDSFDAAPPPAPVDTYTREYDIEPVSYYEKPLEAYYSCTYYGSDYDYAYDAPAPSPEVLSIAPDSASYEPYGAYAPYAFETFEGGEAYEPYGFEPYATSPGAAAPAPEFGSYSYYYPDTYDYPDTYYFAYGDYPAAADEALFPAAAAPQAIAPLDLGSIDVGDATGVGAPEEADTDAAPGPEGVTTEDVREFLQPVLADDGDAEAPATILLEPFAAAGPSRLASAVLPLGSMIVAVACMLA